ncbi:MAG: hypothetical protein FD149_919 [Rhodospirillaceae bacterium]|nr:MAG: hypothetical protein FD149_919 [Rhodospirillaceae bacterium]
MLRALLGGLPGGLIVRAGGGTGTIAGVITGTGTGIGAGAKGVRSGALGRNDQDVVAALDRQNSRRRQRGGGAGGHFRFPADRDRKGGAFARSLKDIRRGRSLRGGHDVGARRLTGGPFDPLR